MNLKKQLLVSVAFCFAILWANAQTETEVVQGLKLPRLTTAERDQIQKQGDPNNLYAKGQVIYNTETNCLEFWNGTKWVPQCGTPPPPVTPPPPTYPEDASGTYRLSGKTCFDVKQGNDNVGECMPLTSRVDDFASTTSFNYTFSGSAAYSELTFYIDNNNDNLLASVSTAGDVFTVTFKNNIHSLAAGTDKTTAKKLTVVAAYKNNIGEDKLISLEVSVQDCSCGCPVKTTGGGWLTFLCYNLGVPEGTKSLTPDQQAAYVSTGDTDATVYGGLYQWGRNTDGHEIRTSGTTATLSTGDIPGHSNFITASSSPYDWRSGQNVNLWQPSTKTNNPCPANYRVPTRAEWQSIYKASGNGAPGDATANKWTWNSSGTAGYKVSPDNGTTTTLFLPAVGLRAYNNGSLDNVGTRGFYWSSTVDSTNAVILRFDSSAVSPSYSNYRVLGGGVRCVAE